METAIGIAAVARAFKENRCVTCRTRARLVVILDLGQVSFIDFPAGLGAVVATLKLLAPWAVRLSAGGS